MIDIISNLCIYFLYFIIYAFLGWGLEVICYLIKEKRFINRGFLLGSYCPIYGWGAIAIILLNTNTTDVLSVFLKSILTSSILEYFTSLIMEILFGVCWWDYSEKKFNINGRICLETMIPFGIFSLIIVYILQPFFSKIINLLPIIWIIVLAITLFIIYLIDNLVTFNILNKIKIKKNKIRKDNTEEIKEAISIWLTNNKFSFRRLKNTFPNFKIK